MKAESKADAHLVVESFDVEDPEARLPPALPAPTKIRVVKIKPKIEKPFSNYQRYAAANKALEWQSIHVTSVGPYISKLDQMLIDEQKAAEKAKALVSVTRT